MTLEERCLPLHFLLFVVSLGFPFPLPFANPFEPILPVEEYFGCSALQTLEGTRDNILLILQVVQVMLTTESA